MKVGVLTFHRASNYGTSLQAAATVEALKKVGGDVEIIDYRPQYIEQTMHSLSLSDIHTLKQLLSFGINFILYSGKTKQKLENFAEFFTEFPVSNKICRDTEEIAAVSLSYDVLISGSDQLWNKNITGADMAYFLPFPHKRKCSYASSFGTSNISEERRKEIMPYIDQFKYLSVREKTAKYILGQILPEKSQQNIECVLDPTFLLTQKEWEKFAKRVPELPLSGYILTYYMIETPLLRKITAKLKRETGLPIVNIKPSKRQILFHEGINLAEAGPAEFLTCYKNADYVVTNSFHGTAFAINFGIPFYTSPLPISMAGEVNSRLKDVINLFGLSEHWITENKQLDKVDSNKKFDVQDILEEKRQKSFKYMSYILGE